VHKQRRDRDVGALKTTRRCSVAGGKTLSASALLNVTAPGGPASPAGGHPPLSLRCRRLPDCGKWVYNGPRPGLAQGPVPRSC